MAVEIQMPAMGESVTEGTVLEWHVSEGQEVAEGDTIVEVSTDKIDAEVPAPSAGVITKLLVQPDDVVKVGQALAELDPDAAPSSNGAGGESGDSADEPGPGLSKGPTGEGDADIGGSDPGQLLDSAQGETDGTSDEVAETPAEPASPSAPSPDDSGREAEQSSVVISMPEMGESVTEGTVLEYSVEVGDHVEEGQTIVEVSTDKVDAEVPSPAAGTITKLLAAPDDVVTVGQPLAELSGGDGAAPDAASTPEAEGAAGEAGPAAAAVDSSGKASPVARRVAAAEGVDLASVQGSGPGGKVVKADVLAAGSGNGATPATAAGEEKPLRGPAAMLAQAMDESRKTPTATSFRTLPVDTLDAKRKAINSQLKEKGIKVSFTHLIAWAIVRAAGELPAMARTFAERDGKPFVVTNTGVNLGIAVDVEKKDGSRALMVPCIKAADQLDFAGFHRVYEELIGKTRENKLTADDFQGTNITLTNPGGIGTVASVPRLMSGQGTIVACGSIAYPVEWAHAPAEKIKALGVSKVTTMTSTYDHRIIQGAESGAFLRRIDQFMQGEDSFYETVAHDLGVPDRVVTNAHPASASAPPLAPAAAGVAGVAAPMVAAEPERELLQAVQAATSLLKAFRTHGHLAARVNPLAEEEPKGDPALEPESLNLTPDLMKRIPASILRIGVEGENLLDALPRMRDAYCGTIAYQIEHLSSHQQRMWLREMIETGAHRETPSADERKALLRRLLEVFQFERFIQKAYLGQKMFSIEGLDVVVPMIDALVTQARAAGAEEVVIGMAHRGRLSVLVHNLGRSPESIMAEFEGAKALDRVKAIAAIPHSGTGDVKYHHGAEGIFSTADGEEIRVRLYPNPSHLEFVDPVVTGGARAAQTEHSGPRLHHSPQVAVPLLLHGDAAFPGQGVVAETLNLQSLKGYSTGGTIHIITDNQVGFTTDPEEDRSTPYASDLAKGFNCPIIHVNADDVEACMAAMRMAMSYRERFERDVVIDLIGYRRYGHNETDEPAYTQPKMAAQIKAHPPVSEIYAKQLAAEGVVTAEEFEKDGAALQEGFSQALKDLRAKMETGDYEDPTATQVGTGELDRTKSPEVETAVSEKRLRGLNDELIRVPDGFAIHRKLRKPLEKRLEILDDGPIEYGHAEGLAYASLLTEGTHIRLTGQDTERGTFSNRHLVLHDEKTGLKYAPIQNLTGALAPFEVHNSPLSEIACLGFEYGYSAASPESLILWEAQFGDFANSAQVIIDSFLVAGESKWGQTTRLTLLLPHGYEGSGPEHSSARIERFIQLAAEGNIRLANPTTAGQYFHLLRRQARIAKPRPLVVFTPKGLLRLPGAASKLSDLTSGTFRFVLDDPRAEGREEEITKLVLCSGKVYYDMDGNDRRGEAGNVAIARVELLYPFARDQIREIIAHYPNLKQIAWVQEEPKNMGAWSVMARRMPELIAEGIEFTYIGRPQRSSPSEGYPAAHRSEQERIVLTALS
ncbi:MAG: multifunctional oxoglutarate decarboxylase/oxoglutarate dehydrogenase thiamine pyrophosphate-binding subunit/dihydrolipoyllysine-residue succinyltransferase subunit [Actinomycetota bacterium]|nr:multifunctional oxoglutarate decarboxylase/oxoglutarate dehydrogenase thiamine pyrophosphate-binding subunit/dihydrolipoyllysine-residue succinyltransferase subunit [Actinomycetota bacterium]